MQDPEPQLQERAVDPVAPDAADPSGAPPFQFRWSWWYLFPAVLIGWLGYSALAHRTSGPETPDSLLTESLAAAQSNRYPECIAAAQRALKLNPNLPEAYNNIGWCSASMGNWDEGIKNVREALRLNPNMERARNNLLWILSQRSGKAPPANPSTPADAAVQLSLEHAQARRFPECVDAARQAIRLNPSSAEAYNNLGYCYAGMQKWDDAITALREALRLRPDFQLASNNLSWVLSEKLRAGGSAGRK